MKIASTLPTLCLIACLGVLPSACRTLPPLESPPEQAENRPAPPATDWASLRSKLTEALRPLPAIEIVDTGNDSLKVRIPVADGFASGKADMRPSLGVALDAVTPTLIAHPEVAVLVIGHTDSQGSEMYNLQLSIARAETVAESLRRRGVALERLSADGLGEADPLVSNASESGRARNRRVELLLRRMATPTPPAR